VARALSVGEEAPEPEMVPRSVVCAVARLDEAAAVLVGTRDVP
jgi:hypothetical protein